MSNICFAGVTERGFVECPACVERYFTYQDTVVVTPPEGGPSFGCKVTRKYRWEICDEGIGIGRHLYSLTLLPGEEIELEVVRKHKFSSSLSSENSIEQELEDEIKIKTLKEWSRGQKLSAEFESSGGVKIFDIGGKTTQEYKGGIEEKESKISEIVETSVSKVSERFEVAIGLKTEVDNKFRAVRKVQNPNNCHPVTYHHYQIVKKFRRRLFLIEQTYACDPPAGDQGSIDVTVTEDLRMPASRPTDVVPTPPDWTISDDRKGRLPSCPEPARDTTITEQTRLIRLKAPTTRDLTAEAAIASLRMRSDADLLAAAIRDLDDFADPGGGGLVSENVYCIGTDSVFVQAQVSDCAVCQPPDKAMSDLEKTKLELEIEQLRCEIARCREALKESKVYAGKPGIDPV